MSINIELENGQVAEVKAGITPLDLTDDAGVSKNKVVAAKLDNEIIELNRPLELGGKLEFILKGSSKDALHVLRHTTAHVMAQAVMRLFKDVEFAIGPTIEDGFYYDFDLEHTLSPEDFEAIEAEMQNIIKTDYPIIRMETDGEGAEKIFGEQRSEFKRELLAGLKGEPVSFYTQDDFTDLCRGPHLTSTGQIGAFKLLSVAGAYWRGNEVNPMLQRIYGTAFFDRKELKVYLRQLEEAKKRDHRKIGAKLDLFSFQPEAPGSAFWHPNGSVVFEQVLSYMREKLFEYDYDEIKTPLILNEQLWRDSGHWDHYRNNMFFTKIDEKDFAVRPMNCPSGTRVFKNGYYSYRDLPIRMAEFGIVHRHEKSGVLNGLFRVRSFTMDDAHIYCTPDQAQDEVTLCIKLLQEVYEAFGFTDYQYELSTRPEKSIGTDEMWEQAESVLEKALEANGIEYQVNHGDGAFYGPKIDVHISDAIKRSWQCATVQIDFSMPERFELSFVDAEGKKLPPVMLHRAILGSMERFIGILIEHYAGKFPTWLAPLQAVVLPISPEKFGDYANGIVSDLRRIGLRVKADMRNESLNKRIRDNQKQYVPYMLVVGEREIAEGTVNVRRRDGVQVSEPMKVEVFAAELIEEIGNRSLELTIGSENQ
ncbi:MAG: threonine--tRNA ligase [Candidatus Electryonea clarkiae]|nr:threonine--tRNA ligase [Candidatus Electryonea clarkiae]MDP8288485.1 threonine--tRNA ligase [Candidatus Electryonea clarkiae]